jgi:hypothetical protein
MRKLVLVAAAAALAIPTTALAAGGGPAATASKARPSVSYTRAQSNAKTVARRYLNNGTRYRSQDPPTGNYGNALNANCSRQKSYALTCKGWVQYVDTGNGNARYSCFFKVQTVGYRKSSGKGYFKVFVFGSGTSKWSCQYD